LGAGVAPQAVQAPDPGGEGGHDPEPVEGPECDQPEEQQHLDVQQPPVARVEQPLPPPGQVQGPGRAGGRPPGKSPPPPPPARAAPGPAARPAATPAPRSRPPRTAGAATG